MPFLMLLLLSFNCFADAARGERLFHTREGGYCILCHQVTENEVKTVGNIGPNLSGVGTRRSEAYLRTIIGDARTFNPETVMPPYGVADAGVRTALSRKGKPVLSGEEISAIVSYLRSLP